jgi:hypothetical protein
MRHDKISRLIQTAAATLITLVVTLTPAESANQYFVDGGVDNNFSTSGNWASSSGGAGGSGSVPGTGDVAVYDSNSPNCTIDDNIEVAGINIESSYTGTVTQGSGKTIEVGTSDFLVSGGAFVGSDEDIDVNGELTLSNCTFSTSSGTLTAAEGVDIQNATLQSVSTRGKITSSSAEHSLVIYRYMS